MCMCVFVCVSDELYCCFFFFSWFLDFNSIYLKSKSVSDQVKEKQQCVRKLLFTAVHSILLFLEAEKSSFSETFHSGLIYLHTFLQFFLKDWIKAEKKHSMKLGVWLTFLKKYNYKVLNLFLYISPHHRCRPELHQVQFPLGAVNRNQQQVNDRRLDSYQGPGTQHHCRDPAGRQDNGTLLPAHGKNIRRNANKKEYKLQKKSSFFFVFLLYWSHSVVIWNGDHLVFIGIY